MVKKIYVQNPNYIRNNLTSLIKTATENHDKFKKGAELRMACYDAQPKLVRQLIGDLGMGNERVNLINARTTKQKCDIIRNMYDRKMKNSSNYIEV